MKKLQLIFFWILMIALCGCKKEAEQGEIPEMGEPMEITSFSFTHTGMSTEQCFLYAAEQTEDGIRLYTETDTESTESQIDQESYENWYNTILDSNYELIMGGADAYEYRDGTSGIGEVIMNSDEIVANAIGYTFLDVNQDGVAELIIGSIDEEKEGKYYGQNIYSAYTYKDMPHLLIEGWSRNRCFLLEDGTFYTEGSGGAMYRILENYVLDENATQLSCKDYYFTKEKDESFEEIGFYHNTTEEWDASLSEELEEDVFWSKYDEYGSKTTTLEFVPFSMYQYVGEQRNIEITEEFEPKE